MKITMGRLIAPRKDRVIQGDLSEIKTLDALTRTSSKIVDCVAKSRLASTKGELQSKVFEAFRKLAGINELETRVEPFGEEIEK